MPQRATFCTLVRFHRLRQATTDVGRGWPSRIQEEQAKQTVCEGMPVPGLRPPTLPPVQRQHRGKNASQATDFKSSMQTQKYHYTDNGPYLYSWNGPNVHGDRLGFGVQCIPLGYQRPLCSILWRGQHQCIAQGLPWCSIHSPVGITQFRCNPSLTRGLYKLLHYTQKFCVCFIPS